MLKRTVLLAAALSFLSPFAATESEAQGLPTFFAVLNGNSECNSVAPPAGPACRKGDPDGFGSATVTIVTGTLLCVGVVVDNLVGATAVHIHSGATTVNGAIVVPISPPLPLPLPPGGGNPGATSGCVPAAAATVAAIRTNPQLFYVNVHNAAFPGGAVRGQLF